MAVGHDAVLFCPSDGAGQSGTRVEPLDSIHATGHPGVVWCDDRLLCRICDGSTGSWRVHGVFVHRATAPWPASLLAHNHLRPYSVAFA